MSVVLATPIRGERRSKTTDLAIVAGAIGLAVDGGAGVAVGRAAGAAARWRGRHPGDCLRVLDGPSRDRLADRGLGPVSADRVRAHRAQDRRLASRCSRRSAIGLPGCSTSRSWGRRSCSVRSATVRSGGRMTQALGPGGVEPAGGLSGGADHHLRRRALRHPLLLRRDADRRPVVRRSDASRHARERRRVAQRRREHLHGADRGAVDDPAVPAGDDAVRADDGDDVRHGPHLRRHHGGLHPVRRRGQTSADRRHHDGARHDHDGQDVRPGNRNAQDDGHRAARRGARPTST